MEPSDILNKLIGDIGRSFDSHGNNCSGGKNSGKDFKDKGLEITPQKLLVIAGLLGGALVVESVLLSKDQVVEIVLSGSLKQKTELEKMLDHIGKMPFDEVAKTMLDRLV